MIDYMYILLLFYSVDTVTVSGNTRDNVKSTKEPDLALELKDRSNRTLCELAIGEVTSNAQQNHLSKNARDLARVGLSLKDALDHLEDKYSVTDAYLIGFQVIGQAMSIYMMSRCGNMYLMVHQDDIEIPDSLRELGTIGTQYKVWHELGLTLLEGIKPVLRAVKEGDGLTTHSNIKKSRLPTLSTPEMLSFMKKQTE
jgi:hypothetical protein